MIQLGRRRGAGPGAAGRDRRGRERCRSPTSSSWSRGCARPSLVRSTRGAHGGYELARAPAEITMAEVVHALEGTLVPMQCFDRARRRAACSATTRSTATRTAPRSCCGPASRAARRARSSRRRSRSWSQFAEHGAAQPQRRAGTRAGATPRPATASRPDNVETKRKATRMADLEIQNLHVNVEGKEILKGVDLTVVARRGARADGAERLRQVDARQHDHGPPELRDHRGQDPLPGRGRDRGRARRARPRRASSWRSSTRPRSRACRSSTSCAPRSTRTARRAARTRST